MADPRFLNPITILSDIGGVQIDITRKIEEIYSANVSGEAIESGSDISDHSVIVPVQLNLDGGFSDIQITKLLGGAFNSRRGRAKEFLDNLLTLFARQEVFDVMNGMHLFENVVFTKLTPVKDKPNFSHSFKAEMRVLQIVETGGLDQTLTDVDVADVVQRAFLQANTVLLSGNASTGVITETFGIVA